MGRAICQAVILLTTCAVLTGTLLAAPTITSLSPPSAGVGQSITISGSGFGQTQGTSQLLFGNGQVPASPTSWSDTAIVTPVPTNLTGTSLVSVEVGGTFSNQVNFTVLATPTITSLSPNTGPIGTWVTISGTNFGSTQGSSTVTFNGVTTTTIQSWGTTSIVVAAPAGTTTGNVVVTVSGVPSAGTLFTEFTTPPIPQVVQVQPANSGTGIPLNGRVLVRFAQPVPAVSVVNGILTLAHGSTSIAGTVAQSNDGLSLTFIPSSNLTASTTYTASVQDIGAGATSPQFQSSFTSGASVDSTAPQYVQISPPRGASGVPINSPLVMQFTKPMDPSTLSPQQLNVIDNTTGNVVAGMIQVDASGLTASFVPQTNLGIGRSFSSASAPQFRDTSGNLPSSSTSFSFTTGYATDTQGPTLVGVSPSNSATAIPLNAQVVLEFDRPLDVVSVSNSFQVQTGGNSIRGGIALSDSNKRIVFTPTGGLTANTTYSVVTTSQITDVAGYGMANPGTYTFTTGTSSDGTTPSVTAISPANSALSVPTNAIVQLQFSKSIDPITATAATFRLYPVATSIPVAGTIIVAANGFTATFTPSVPLDPSTSFQTQATTGITDIEGHALAAFGNTFTTGLGTSSSPTVVTVSPENGLTGVPVNARVDVVASSPLSAASVNSGVITLSTAGQQVSGSTALSSDRMSITFIPGGLLATSTVYTVTVSGATDQAGNAITPFTSSFTTSASGTANSTKPAVVSISPSNGASGVAVTSSVTLTFNEPVDFKTINNSSVPVSDYTVGAQLAGSYSIDSTGTIVTFTPLTQLPGNSTIGIAVNTNGVSDLCGNLSSSYSSSFRTTSVTDTTPPAVVNVTPANGAANIGLNAQVVLTFSKSLNAATVGVASPNLALYANSAKLGTGITISADNRTVTLTPSLPANSTVAVFATSGITDLSGNALPNFESQFMTGAGPDSTYAMVVAQRPGNAAYNVPLNSNIVLYINEPMNVSTLSGALHVSQNGISVTGTTQITDSGQVIQFTPSVQWQPDALVQVFVDSTALDTDGNAMNSYQASFTTLPDNSTKAPNWLSSSPFPNASGIPTNVTIDLAFDEALNPATLNTDSAACYQNNSWLQGAVNLLNSGTMVQIAPRFPLPPNTAITCSVSGSVQGINGIATAGTNVMFTTGSGPDATAPTLISVSPPNGYTNVGDNANVRLVFSKPINPLTVNSNTVQLTGGGITEVPDSISFSSNNQSVLIVPHAPLPDATQMTLTLNGITDVAGNALALQTVQFTTGTGPDLVAPVVVNISPYSSAVNVPLNGVIALQANEPIDPGSVNSTTFPVTDLTTSQQVSGAYSVSSDGLTITFLPSAPLVANNVYSFNTASPGITDLAGNILVSTTGRFTAGTTNSTTAPQVMGISPGNAATAIPTNAQVVVQFNEPVDSAKTTGITLKNGGGTVNTSQVFSNGNQTVTLIPALPLAPSTTYTVTVSGIQDLSGNTMGTPVTSTFTTSAGINGILPSVSSASPANGASGVSTSATVQLQFAYPINPMTLTTSTFEVYPSQTQIPISGTVSVASNGMSATFTPSQPLDPSTTFIAKLTGGDLDLEGRGLTYSSSFTTASGSSGLAPVIRSLSLNASTAGAIQYIYGNYFGTSQGTSTVNFNGVNASVSSWSDTQIVATIPSSGTSGPITVTVNGTASNGVLFKYLATPTITSVSPNSGAAGTSVTISGTNLGDSYDATQVSFGGVFATPTTWNATSLTVLVPTGAASGNVSLSVSVNNYSSSATSFNVIPTPSIIGISPGTGVAGTPVSLTGANFGTTQGSSTVLFNGVPAASISNWNPSAITAVAPSNVTSGPVTVTVNSVPSNTNQVFTVTVPSIGSLSPPAAADSAYITVNGSNLYAQGLTTQVLFNGIPGNIVYYNGQQGPGYGNNITSLYVQVPYNATTGSVTVMVGNIATNSLPFTVEQPPTITGISPTSGQIGSWPITISGSGFGATQSNSTVNFYGNVPAQIVSWSDTEIQVVVPDGTSTGPFLVQVGGITVEGPWFYINAITQLTDSLGNQSQYTSAVTGGSWGTANSQGPGCVTCTVRGNTQETVDANGNLLTHTDDLGHTTTYTYDSNNNTASVSQQLDPNTSVTTTYTYNSFGEVLTATDPLGNVTTNAYDANGNLTSVTTPVPDGHTPASVTKFSYDTKGELTQIIDPLNNPTTIAYTPTGLIASITDAQNNTTSYQYDARGNRTAVIDPINGAAHPTAFTYDVMNRLTGITYPDGSSVSFGYDYRGRRTSVTDQNQKTTTYAYDDADRLISVTDPANNITQYNYDTEDNLASITDANGHTTNFSYNARGWVTQTTFPSTLYDTYGYDAVGNLTSKTDRKNQTIQYVYDALNRLIQKNYPDSTSANYAYDLVGRIRQVTDPTGTYGFAYDNIGRLIGTTTQYSFLTGTYSNSYTYDAASNRISLTAPDGSITTYGYDTLNRLNGLANSWAGSFGFGYDALSRRTSLTRPNGVNTNYNYDSVSHLLSVLHQAGSSVLDGASYTYDNAGNRLSKINYLNGITENYTYDPLYQLTQVTQGGGTSESYSYDAVGNRLSSLGVPSYQYNSSNELTSTSLGGYTYDANGNTLTDAQGRSFTWDFDDRLIQAVVPGQNGGTTTFKYDPFGRRIEKSGPLGTTNYLFDGENPLEEVDGAGNVLARYTASWRIDDFLSALRSGTTSYFQQDGLGSVTSLSSTAGAVANTYTYDSFGNLTASTGSITNPFRFTGRDFDSETGLYSYRSRYFDPVTGRFNEEDAIGFNGGKNFYAYVENNPVTNVDPLGLAKCIYSITTHTLVCIPNADQGWPAPYGPNEQGSIQLGPGGVWSGVQGCANNPKCINDNELGPIVPGNYNMNEDDRPGHGGFWRLEPVPHVSGWKCRLGLARCGFELHPGRISLGCITANKNDPQTMQQYNAINNLLNQENGNNHLMVMP